jgi:hypothetical protein
VCVCVCVRACVRVSPLLRYLELHGLLIAGNAVLQAMRHLAMRYREDFQAFGCIPGTAEKTRAEQRNAEQEKFGFELQRADSQFRLIR